MWGESSGYKVICGGSLLVIKLYVWGSLLVIKLCGGGGGWSLLVIKLYVGVFWL